MSVIVLGSQNSNIEDREMSRDEISGFQLFDGSDFFSIPALDNKNKLGVSSLCFQNKFEFFLTHGDNLQSVNIKTGAIKEYHINQIKGIHEITYVDEELWLSNTHYDEIVSFKKGNIDRISLKQFSNNSFLNIGNNYNEKFHCNQIFKGFDEALYVLVHHYDGSQFINKLKTKVLKSHGNGGVINISEKKRINLKLKAPHTIRKVDGNYWVFSSGDQTIKIFNKQWELLDEINTIGWGRGADTSNSGKEYICGISSTRKRYRDTKKQVTLKNMLQIIDIESKETVSHITVPKVEQINNIYTIDDDIKACLLDTFENNKYHSI